MAMFAARMRSGLGALIGALALGACSPSRPMAPPGCRSDAECDDGWVCNGLETCAGGNCEPGTAPACDDGLSCTIDACVEGVAGGCTHVPACDDGSDCTEDRCDGATGACVYSPRDRDLDGYGDALCQACDAAGTCTNGTDCDDTRADIHPGVPEICDDRIDDNCDGLIDYDDPACLPPNDTCASVQILPGPGIYAAGTRGTALDYGYPCATGLLHDVVFEITVPALFDVYVRAIDAPDATYAIVLEASCGDPVSVLRCQSSGDLYAQDVSPGTYFIRVATVAETGFDLQVEFLAPHPVPPPERCATAGDVSAGGNFTGTFLGTTDTYSASCGSGHDLVFKFAIGQSTDVRIQGESRNGLDDDYLTLSVETTCGDPATETACQTRLGIDEIVFRNLGPGTYYILAQDPLEGPSLALWVTFSSPATPVPGDECADAIPLPNGVLTTVDFPSLWDDYAPSCDVADWVPYVDAVYSFSVSVPSDVVVDAYNYSYTVLAIESTCGDRATDLACTLDTTTRTVARGIAPGTYYVIDETGDYAGGTPGVSNAGQLILNVFPTGTTAPGDRCSTPLELPQSGTVQGSLTGMFADYSSSCGAGLDVVYHVNLAATSDLYVRLTPTTTYRYLPDPSGSLRGTCDVGPDLACLVPGAPVFRRGLLAGDYYVLVADSRPVPFDLDVVVSPNEPTQTPTGNDLCAAAWIVGPTGGHYAGNTTAMTDDTSPSCAMGSSPDVAFRIDLATRSRIVLNTIGTAFAHALYLRATDCSTADQACVQGPGPAGAYLDLTLDPGTYFAIVDGAGAGSAGAYTLDVSISAP